MPKYLSGKWSLSDYDKYMAREPLEQQLMLACIRKKYDKNHRLRIAEFGAGTGRFSRLLLRAFPNADITLVEPDTNCVAKLKRLANGQSNLHVVESTGENFTSKKRFDVIAMATAFHHVPFEHKLRLLRGIKYLLTPDGLFVCGDNFIAEYRTMKQRRAVIRASMNKWIREADGPLDLKIARKMKELTSRPDHGGEYFLCPSLFERFVRRAGLRIAGKVNVTNADPRDMENYFYLALR